MAGSATAGLAPAAFDDYWFRRPSRAHAARPFLLQIPFSITISPAAAAAPRQPLLRAGFAFRFRFHTASTERRISRRRSRAAFISTRFLYRALQLLVAAILYSHCRFSYLNISRGYSNAAFLKLELHISFLMRRWLSSARFYDLMRLYSLSSLSAHDVIITLSRQHEYLPPPRRRFLRWAEAPTNTALTHLLISLSRRRCFIFSPPSQLHFTAQ